MVFRVELVTSLFGKTTGAPKTFFLTQDRWDDYGYKTLYRLSYTDASGQMRQVGNVKILRANQEISAASLITNTFDALPDEFCSLGQSLDYYQRIAEMDEAERRYILLALKDVVQDPSRISRFQHETGWKKSVLRDFASLDDFLPLATTILEQNYSALPSLDARFTFRMAEWSNALEFAFDAPPVPDVRSWGERQSSGPGAELPRRISVVIGRNGSGKSTLLARLARFAHASRGDRLRTKLANLGELKPVGLGFSRVLTVSYSGFDNFQVPGLTVQERQTIAEELTRGSGRFIFCGLRDIGAELAVEQREQQALHPEGPLADRQQTTALKSAKTLSEEFARTVERIKTMQRMPLLSTALRPILADPSFNDLRETLIGQLKTGDCARLFLGWSTGHKIVLHVICSLVAYLEPRALVLFDEPETHLHPPLLASLMHSLRAVLADKDSYAVVATHSPVVLQETMARHVHIISREGAQTVVQRPAAETFGENIGILTSSIFNLTSEVTDYNETLKRLVGQVRNLDELEKLFETGGLSLQARAFVMSVLASAG